MSPRPKRSEVERSSWIWAGSSQGDVSVPSHTFYLQIRSPYFLYYALLINTNARMATPLMKYLFIPLLLLFTSCATSDSITYQTDTDQLLTYTNTITEDFLRGHLEVLADDSLEGRDTAMPGQKKAANYIAHFYADHNIAPKGDDGSYFQKIDFNATITDSLVYETTHITGSDSVWIDRTVESPLTYGNYSRIFGGAAPIKGDIVFAGFGINDESRSVAHLDGDSLEGNWALIFEDVPFVVEGDTLINPSLGGNNRLGQILRNYGAAGILVISDEPESDYIERAKQRASIINAPSNLTLSYLEEDGPGSRGFSFGYNEVSPGFAALLLDLDSVDELHKLKESITADITNFSARTTSHYLKYTPYTDNRDIVSENVIAYMEGADPELKNEALVLMAHYDHVGVGQPDETGDAIYNGADDNGSGTTALLGIANALKEAQTDGYKPRRSVLFVHVTAEEIGLLGSRYYSDHPVIPIENTVAAFNADMIGRSDPYHMERGETDYVYLIGGEIISSELDSLVVSSNEESVQMTLDRRYNDLTDRNQFYRRSDHWNMGRLGVPFVFFFTGVHEDYHQPSDSVDKIQFEKYSRVAKLIYASSIKVLNYDGRPVVDNQEFIDITGQQPR